MVDHFTKSQYASLLNLSSTQVNYKNFHSKISAQHVITVMNSILLEPLRRAFFFPWILLQRLCQRCKTLSLHLNGHDRSGMKQPIRNNRNFRGTPPTNHQNEQNFCGNYRIGQFDYWKMPKTSLQNEQTKLSDQIFRTSKILSPWKQMKCCTSLDSEARKLSEISVYFM